MKDQAPKLILFNLILVFSLVLTSTSTLLGQSNFTTNGNWNVASNWSPASVPNSTAINVTTNNNISPVIVNGDNFSIGNVTADGDLTVQSGGTLTLGSSALFNIPTKKNLTFNNNKALTVAGSLVIWGDLIVNNTLTLTLTGTMIVHGNIIMANGGEIIVSGAGSLTVGGSITGANNSKLTTSGSGTIAVTGSITLGGGSSAITGPVGSITAGSCSINGSPCGPTVLPIELLFFKGSKGLSNVNLKWATASELNFDYFDIEKSSNGIDFNSIIHVKGNGTTNEQHNYTFDDEKPYMGKNYYRLKSIDFDGYTETFNIVMVDFDGSKDFFVSPNPSDGISFTAETNFTPDSRAFVVVYTTMGSEIARFEVSGGSSTLTLPVKLESGVYYAKYLSGNFTSTKRVVVR